MVFLKFHLVHLNLIWATKSWLRMGHLLKLNDIPLHHTILLVSYDSIGFNVFVLVVECSKPVFPNVTPTLTSENNSDMDGHEPENSMDDENEFKGSLSSPLSSSSSSSYPSSSSKTTQVSIVEPMVPGENNLGRNSSSLSSQETNAGPTGLDENELHTSSFSSASPSSQETNAVTVTDRCC